MLLLEIKYFCRNISHLSVNAQMAELVDAMVSNTIEVTLVPVRPRLWVLESFPILESFFIIYSNFKYMK